MEAAGCVVIGAGVIGLAVAREAARAGREVVVVEAARRPGAVTSSRNSEVIHAGIYYAAGSLKARLCVEGRERLYRYCEEHRVAHRRIGKLVVEAEGDAGGRLMQLAEQARANGVADLV
ncbi:MAG: FAD-dependent oxidoreductase, partial [Proteobacteria bacterium]|nr:FAD-dependent oxidoreductase [Pseudomonadota bacterium]